MPSGCNYEPQFGVERACEASGKSHLFPVYWAESDKYKDGDTKPNIAPFWRSYEPDRGDYFSMVIIRIELARF